MIKPTTTKIINVAILLLSVACVSFAQETKFDAAAAAAQVTEFDVNGLKVIVKRRASAPTVAAGLFVRGGSRNIDAKTAGIEDLTLKSAIEAGKKFPRQIVRRELSKTGSAIGASASEDYTERPEPGDILHALLAPAA